MGNLIRGVQIQELDFASDSLPFEMDFNLAREGKIADLVTIIIDNDQLTGGDASSDIGLSAYMGDVDSDLLAVMEAVLLGDLVGTAPSTTVSIATTATQAANKIIRRVLNTSALQMPIINCTSILRLNYVLTAGQVYTAGKIRAKVLASYS
jgi:hypothetical protein